MRRIVLALCAVLALVVGPPALASPLDDCLFDHGIVAVASTEVNLAENPVTTDSNSGANSPAFSVDRASIATGQVFAVTHHAPRFVEPG